MDDDDDFEDNENGIRVLGIAYIAERYVTGCYIFEAYILSDKVSHFI